MLNNGPYRVAVHRSNRRHGNVQHLGEVAVGVVEGLLPRRHVALGGGGARAVLEVRASAEGAAFARDDDAADLPAQFDGR